MGCGLELYPINGDLRLEGYGQAGRWKLSGDVHFHVAVLGNRLLRRIERSDDKVGLLPKNQGS